MGLLRPATPGFLVTLAATALLAVVVFCVPYFKSVYFLKAAFDQDGQHGYITLGTLGYCFAANGASQTCSSPSVGYEFDPNKLLGNNLKIQIPEVAVKWLTYALVTHIIALGLAAISAFFGLLAHVREMSMTCFSTCFSGGAAAIALIAFIFDLVFFFVAKDRINKVQGGSATIGTAIWLTLAAWLLLFFAGCFFGLGKCCIGSRSGGMGRKKRNRTDSEDAVGGKMPGAYAGSAAGGASSYPDNSFNDSLRMAAIKAEADRKARAAANKEQGLPAFEEYAPLRQHQYVNEDELYSDNDPRAQHHDHAGAAAAAGVGAAAGLAAANHVHRQPSGYSQNNPGVMRQPTSGSTGTQNYPGGYAGGAPGTRAIDDYYNGGNTSNNAYPPTPSQPPTGAAAALSPTGAGPSYGIGAVYGAPAGGRQDQYGQAHGYPEDAYAAGGHAQQASYDPYAQHEPAAAYYDPHSTAPGATPYSQYGSGYPTGQTYVTANDHTPAPSSAAYPSYGDRQDSSYFPRANPAAPAGMPAATAVAAGYAAHSPSSQYSPHSMNPPTVRGGGASPVYSHESIPTPTARSGAGVQQPHDWNQNAEESQHHGTNEETLPEYNPYEEPGPSIPSALASGGPPRGDKR